MAGEFAGSDEPRWLLEPPEPGRVHVHVAVGEGTELTPQLHEAIEGLIRSLQEQEVEGYATSCPQLTVCDSKGYCKPRTDQPCAQLVTCRIDVPPPPP